MIKHHPENGARKRIVIIGIILVVLALLIVTLAARKDRALTSEMAPDAYEMMYVEESGFDEGVMAEPLPMALERVAPNQKMMVSNVDITTDMAIMPSPEVFPDDSVPHPDTEAHIIKNGNLSLLVASLNTAVATITTIAQNYGGDITAANFSTLDNNTRYGFVTVKVPVDTFDGAMTDIKKVASVVSNESISTHDVTEQVIDLQATITNKKAQEERLRAFFDRAEDVKDLLAVEKELTSVRGEIERLEGRLKSLTNRTSFSTITAHLTEDAKITVPQEGWRPGQVAKDAVNDLIKKFQNIVDTSIDLLIASLPVFLLSLVGLWIIYVIGKKVIAAVMRRIDRK